MQMSQIDSLQIRSTSLARARAGALLIALLACGLIATACGSASSSSSPKHQGDGKLNYTETAKQAAARKVVLLKRLGVAAPAATGVGCQITTPRTLTPLHEDGITPGEWDTDPPSSGPHNVNWADWGRYDTALPDTNAVHNLEHGGVIIWFGPQVPVATIDLIDTKLLKKGRKLLLLPREQLGGSLVATAWGSQLRCSAAALAKLRSDGVVLTLGSWYDATNSQGEKKEKQIPAYAGPLKAPKPVHDISLPRPNF